MTIFCRSILLLTCFCSCLTASDTYTKEGTPLTTTDNATAQSQIANFESFTGQVIANNVRIRIAPTLEAAILRESNRNEYLLVTGEEEDFYRITPPHGIKTYLFRTFILDGVVEGSNVNIRLAPNLEAPIIAQLSTGTPVSGEIAKEDSKWLEITPPASTRFYIAKEFIEKVGDSNFLANREQRERELHTTFSQIQLEMIEELDKPFPEMDVDSSFQSLDELVQNYSEFEPFVTTITDTIDSFRDIYLDKKIAFLEEQNQRLAVKKQVEAMTLEVQVEEKAEPLPSEPLANEPLANVFPSTFETTHTAEEQWESAESNYYQEWARTHTDTTQGAFEREEFLKKTDLAGVLRPYTRPVKNIPGQYVLIDENSNVPLAFVYSTKVNLQENVGKAIVVEGNERPNNHFAFPAYHITAIR